MNVALVKNRIFIILCVSIILLTSCKHADVKHFDRCLGNSDKSHPKSLNNPVKRVALKKPPFESNDYSLLYVYDQNADYNFNIIKEQNSDFEEAIADSFWGEIVDGQYYSVPEIDNCMLEQLLKTPINFHANKNSALIIHLHSASCLECNKTIKSIIGVIKDNQYLDISWVDIEIDQNLPSLFN